MAVPRGVYCAGAVLGWTASGAFTVAAYMGDLERCPGCGRVFDLIIALSVTLTVVVAVRTYAIEPRHAYRLGWDARGRHDGHTPAEVIGMEGARRRAQ